MNIKNELYSNRPIGGFDNRWQSMAWRPFFLHEPIKSYRLGGVQFLSDCSAGDAMGARDYSSVNGTYSRSGN